LELLNQMDIKIGQILYLAFDTIFYVDQSEANQL
jgi:hypothetical protein